MGCGLFKVAHKAMISFYNAARNSLAQNRGAGYAAVARQFAAGRAQRAAVSDYLEPASGPCGRFVWTHPDVGTGVFYVIVEPVPGGAIPPDLKIEIGVQPVTGRLAEVIYPTQLENQRGQVQYRTQAEFDRARAVASAADRKEFARGRRGDGGRGSDSAGIRPLGFADVFAAVSGRGISVVPSDHAQTKVPEKPTAKGMKLTLNAISEFASRIFRAEFRAQCGIRFPSKSSPDASARNCWSLRLPTAMVLCVCAVAVTFAGCESSAKLPEKGSKEYAEVVSAFYMGLAALQVGDDVHAESKLSEVTQLVPAEPAGWANWGVLALRQRNYDAAAQRLGTGARSGRQERSDLLFPGNSGEHARQFRGSDRRLRKAMEFNPKNLRAAYAAGARKSSGKARPTARRNFSR